MAKHKLGQRMYVELADGSGYVPVTIEGRETHNHFEFYRVREMPGSLYLSRSLLTESRKNIREACKREVPTDIGKPVEK